MLKEMPIRWYVAAVSCGVVDGVPVLDLDYAEDFKAGTDLNCVMVADGRLIEVQATAEKDPYARQELEGMLDLARKGCRELMAHQKRAIAALG